MHRTHRGWFYWDLFFPWTSNKSCPKQGLWIIQSMRDIVPGKDTLLLKSFFSVLSITTKLHSHSFYCSGGRNLSRWNWSHPHNQISLVKKMPFCKLGWFELILQGFACFWTLHQCFCLLCIWLCVLCRWGHCVAVAVTSHGSRCWEAGRQWWGHSAGRIKAVTTGAVASASADRGSCAVGMVLWSQLHTSITPLLFFH